MEIAETVPLQRRLNRVGGVDYVPVSHGRTGLITFERDEAARLVILPHLALTEFPFIRKARALVRDGGKVKTRDVAAISEALVQGSAGYALRPPVLAKVHLLRVHRMVLALPVKIAPVEVQAVRTGGHGGIRPSPHGAACRLDHLQLRKLCRGDAHLPRRSGQAQNAPAAGVERHSSERSRPAMAFIRDADSYGDFRLAVGGGRNHVGSCGSAGHYVKKDRASRQGQERLGRPGLHEREDVDGILRIHLDPHPAASEALVAIRDPNNVPRDQIGAFEGSRDPPAPVGQCRILVGRQHPFHHFENDARAG